MDFQNFLVVIITVKIKKKFKNTKSKMINCIFTFVFLRCMQTNADLPPRFLDSEILFVCRINHAAGSIPAYNIPHIKLICWFL